MQLRGMIEANRQELITENIAILLLGKIREFSWAEGSLVGVLFARSRGCPHQFLINSKVE
jgi:hypothetical protein